MMVSIFLPIFVQFLESIQRCGKAMSWSASNWRPFDKPILPKRRRPRPRFSTYFTESDPIFFFSTFVGLHLKNQFYQEGKWESQHISKIRFSSWKDNCFKWNCLCISVWQNNSMMNVEEMGNICQNILHYLMIVVNLLCI